MPVDAKQTEAIFFAALEKSSGAERSKYLDEVCAGDLDLRRQLDALLQAHDHPESFLDFPVVENAQTLLPDGSEAAASEADVDATRTVNPGGADQTQGTRSHGPYWQYPDPANPGGDLKAEDKAYLSPSSRPGSLGRLGHYEILEIVGRGGMGVVLRAFDEKLHRIVAIKVMAPELAVSGTARQRFVREARAAAPVTHEHVISIHAVETEGPVPYIAMQFVDGTSLDKRIQAGGALPLKEILRIGLQIAEGLAAAHKHGLVHRD
ncbi:MAG TPA: serine/threonine-protein kinase, partial [Gemmataceae bacterium]|nr:serine/threonine-protein kinase [Gemmataceae bacterium]